MGTLQLNDSTSMEVPFEFERMGDQKALVTFINGSEKIKAEDAAVNGDSVFIKMAVFDSEFRLRLKDKKMSGVWINHARQDKNVIPFSAAPYKKESGGTCSYCSELTGRWHVTFSPGTPDSSKAIGVFKGLPHYAAEGTFMTETGDYRYLWGNIWKNRAGELRFTLQCFDGAHAFFFDAAVIENGEICGSFYSGAHHYENWRAAKNPDAKLRDADKITRLRQDSSRVNFTFPSLQGKKVSLSDEKFRNKVVIVQVMGSWCPNCMDETKYLSEFYKRNKAKGLEVIALAYEKTSDFNKAAANVARLKKKFGVNYEMLITGLSGSQEASQSLPALNGISAFPTTIYIDRKGKVRKVYTGYYGPATGPEHERFKKEHEAFVNLLLAEH